jgi:hypothetical protein
LQRRGHEASKGLRYAPASRNQFLIFRLRVSTSERAWCARPQKERSLSVLARWEMLQRASRTAAVAALRAAHGAQGAGETALRRGMHRTPGAVVLPWTNARRPLSAQPLFCIPRRGMARYEVMF